MTDKLLAWYNANKRDLPWRADGGVYAVLVSEMMLQQTVVETVLGYYARFMARFPDVHALAAADEQEVLALWQGLGYYARARSLHNIARQIARRGAFPDAHAGWLALKGVGPYMAGAMMSIALGQPYAAVDGNVMRVVSRLYALREDTTSPSARRAVTARVEALMPGAHAGDFTQALMELGALVCRPASPACPACPLAQDCAALRQGLVREIPVRKPRPKQRTVRLWVAVIEAAGCVALEYRDEQTLLARMWGLPLAEQDGNRTPEALFAQKYGVRLTNGRAAGRVVHVFTHLRWEMDILRFSLPGLRDLCGAWEWTNWAQIGQKPVPGAFRRVLDAVRKKEDG